MLLVFLSGALLSLILQLLAALPERAIRTATDALTSALGNTALCTMLLLSLLLIALLACLCLRLWVGWKNSETLARRIRVERGKPYWIDRESAAPLCPACTRELDLSVPLVERGSGLMCMSCQRTFIEK